MIFIVRLGRLNAKRDNRFRIGRPGGNAVQVLCRAIGGQLHFRAIAVTDHQIEIFHYRRRFAIGRFALTIERRIMGQICAIGAGFRC